jgi:cytochrome c-type biogenesis protein CcsB
MLSSTFLGLTTFTYLLCMLLYFSILFFRHRGFALVTSCVVVIGLALNTAGLGLRWYESYALGYGRIPLTNMYEALVVLAWSTVIVYLVIEYRYKVRQLGSLVFPVVSLAMAYASLSPSLTSEIKPLMPALQSNWLTYHVITCFLGYSAFAISFGASIAYLIKARRPPAGIPADKAILPSLRVLDEIIYKTIAIGFLMLGVGIITGAIWANYAWGRYWSWDPKETWSLITWLVYAAFLHARITRGWRGKRTAVLSIFGFACVLFCFVGVNLWLPGLHSYA